MNSEPCVRFGIRISPKISEKPADSRNSTPPKVMLLTVSSNQKFMGATSRLSPIKRLRRRSPQRPLPLVGRDRVGCSQPKTSRKGPYPDPPPQGGREHAVLAARRRHTHRHYGLSGG